MPPPPTHSHTHLLPQAYIIALGEPTGREPGAGAPGRRPRPHLRAATERRRQSPPNRACPPPRTHTHTHTHTPAATGVYYSSRRGGRRRVRGGGARPHPRERPRSRRQSAPNRACPPPLARTHTHTHTGAGYNSRPPRRVRASGARAHRARERRGAARLYRGRPRPTPLQAATQSRRQSAPNRACPTPRSHTQACYNSRPPRRVRVGGARPQGARARGAARLEGGPRPHRRAARAAAEART